MIDELKQVLCLVQKYDYGRAIGSIFVCGTEVKAEARHTGAGPLAHDAPLYGCGDDVALTRPTTSKPHMADKASHGIRHSHDYSVASVHGATAAAGGDGIPRRRSPPVSFFFSPGPDGQDWNLRQPPGRPVRTYARTRATLWTSGREYAYALLGRRSIYIRRCHRPRK